MWELLSQAVGEEPCGPNLRLMTLEAKEVTEAVQGKLWFIHMKRQDRHQEDGGRDF